MQDEKREIRRKLRNWRRKGEEEGYKRGKQEYRELCERKKKDENLRWEKKAVEVSREREVWEIVKKQRKKKKRINEDLGWEEWKEHFMKLLRGVKDRVVREKESNRRGGDEKDEISGEEVMRVVVKLKDGKAAGMDGILNEVWRYVGGGDKGMG